jgi:sporulation protein YlmC with PRC-barrel domain
MKPNCKRSDKSAFVLNKIQEKVMNNLDRDNDLNSDVDFDRNVDLNRDVGLDRDVLGNTDDQGPGPEIMGANTLIGNDVVNHMEEDLGDIKEIMLDMSTGKVAYAVLSIGGFMGMGDKLFAVPWSALKLDTANERFVLNVDKARLETAPGFDKDDWPDMSDPTWQEQVGTFYENTGSSMGDMGRSTTGSGEGLR